MTRALAFLAVVICLSSQAEMTGAEYKEFRTLIAKTQAQLDEVNEAMDNLDSMVYDTYNSISKLNLLLGKYKSGRWDGVKSALEEARVVLEAEHERLTSKAASIANSAQTVVSVCNEIDSLVMAGYKRYAEVDAQASQYLGALSTIPFDRIATKEDFIKAYGYFGFIKYDGWHDDEINIDFVCRCRDNIGDDEWFHRGEYEAVKNAIDEYDDLYASLASGFENLSQGGIPQ